MRGSLNLPLWRLSIVLALGAVLAWHYHCAKCVGATTGVEINPWNDLVRVENNSDLASPWLAFGHQLESAMTERVLAVEALKSFDLYAILLPYQLDAFPTHDIRSPPNPLVIADGFEQSQQTDAKARCLEIEEAVYGYKMKHAKFPNTLEDLSQPDPANNKEAWIDADRLKDPWGHGYIMKIEGSRVMIMSYGQDGQPGGEGYDADITKKGIQESSDHRGK